MIKKRDRFIFSHSSNQYKYKAEKMNKEKMLSKPVGHEFNVIDQFKSIRPSQRVHLILLGVSDVRKSVAFYEALGWKESVTSYDQFAKIDLGGMALILMPKEDLAKDANSNTQTLTDYAGIGFVYLAKTPEEIPTILQRAEQAGGKIVKPATRHPWGIAGYFRDLDGHLFEVDYEAAWVLDDDHRLVVDQVNT